MMKRFSSFFIVKCAYLLISFTILSATNWTNWTSSSCDHPCGIGHQYKVRQCNYDGENPRCVGETMQVDVCHERDCPLYRGNDCYDAKNPDRYRGFINTSWNGKDCFKWNHAFSIYLPEDYPNSGLEKNYCRNPGASATEPWCYTNRKRTRANFCRVPSCPTTQEVYWNSWSQWTTCSVTCGASGFKYRVRSCFGGGVTQGGCQGDVFEKVECAVIPCNKNSSITIPHKDCAVLGNTSRYFGNISLTVNGVECQRWDSQTPHQHGYNPSLYPTLSENFCRNPDGDVWPWCMTTGSKQWDYCDIPECESNPTPLPAEAECFVENHAQDYRGSASITLSGYSCQFWDSNSPNQHGFKSYLYPESGLGHHNFCRSPDNDSIPWCITTRPGYLWEHCEVNECSAQDPMNTTSSAYLTNQSFSSCGKPSIAIRVESADSSSHDGQRIVGGTTVNKGSIPWQVALSIASTQRQICGASIIHKHWIMSAAHCMVSGPDPLLYYGVAGRHWHDGGGKEEVKLNFQKIIVHESYHSSKLINDIALLKLSKSLIFNVYIKPVCLPAPSNEIHFEVGEHVLVTGWGRTSANIPVYPEALQQVYVPLVSQKVCEQSHPGQVYKGMICAGYVTIGEKDSCMGDSGGPLVSLSTYEQIGIVSWGQSCAEPGYPGVYTFVPLYVRWIYEQMKLN